MNLDNYRLWTALVTPLTPGLSIDYISLEKILREQDSAGNGILILGSTGEALNLSTCMKKDILNFSVKLNLKSPIMVGIGGHDLEAQKDWVQWLENKAIHAYLMVSPIYSKPGATGQTKWFTELMSLASKPVMLYNVPGRSGSELSLETVEQLKDHPLFMGIKEASGCVKKFTSYLAACKGKVYCGDDALMSEFASAGSYGLISVASNTWPKETNKYVELCLSQKLEAKDLWAEAANSLFIASNPIPAKALMHKNGTISHPTMMPPLAEEDMRNTEKLIFEDKKIKSWFKTL